MFSEKGYAHEASESIPARMSIPEFFNPKDKPPIPQKTSIADNFRLLIFKVSSFYIHFYVLFFFTNIQRIAMSI